MKQTTLLFFSALFSAQLYSQITFQRVVGIDAGQQETGESILQMPSGSFMISGNTFDNSTSLQDAMIVKTSATGVPLWNKKFGTAAGNDAFVSSFRASDGSYYFAGTRENTTTYQDIYVVRTDSTGTALWEKTYNMPSQEYAVEIRDAGAGNAIVVTDAGTVIKINSSGTILWQKLYTGCGLEDIIPTSDGGYMIAGTGGSGQGQLIKIDVSGNVTWSKTYGDIYNNGRGQQVLEAPDGSFYFLTVKSYLFPGDSDEDMVLVKTNSTGTILWCKSYTKSAETIYVFDMSLTSDGGVVICGQGSPFTGVALKVTPSGTVSWDAKYGANMSMTADRVYSVVQTTDGGYAYTGSSYSFGTATSQDDFYVIKTDAAGATGGCYQTAINYVVGTVAFTATTISQAASTGTFTTSTVTSALSPATLFTNIACSITTGPIVADFVANTTTVLQGGTVDFTDLSSSFPTGWSWSFTGGSPATSTTQNPTGIAYNTLGCFTVTLTASNASTSDVETKTCYINVVQDSSTSFQRVIGVDSLQQETGESIIQMSDGGYMISGNTFDNATSLQNAMIVRTSASGAPMWHKEFGTTAGSDAFVSSFLASDGSFYFAGTRDNGATYQDIYLVKTDASGTTLWEKTYKMPSQEYAVEIADGGAGNVIIVTDVGTVLKINSSGTVLWQKLYTGGGLEDIILTSDGGYMLAATGGSGQGQLIKLDVSGNVTWTKTYGDVYNNGRGQQVIEAPDGSFYFLTVKSYLFPGDSDEDMVLVKTNSTGSILWCKSYTKSGESIYVFDMKLTSDGGVVICGQGSPFTGVALKVNPSGTVAWDAKYGANMSMTADRVYSVVETADGGFAFTGSSYSFGTANSQDDFYLVKADASGSTGGCYQTTISYDVANVAFTATTVSRTTSAGTFTTATVTSAVPPVYLFTNIVCAPVVPGTYCSVTTSAYGTTQGDFVDGVVLGTINNNNSGSVSGPFYTDYTASMSTIVNATGSYTLNIKSGTWPAGYADRYAAWIDYNGDGDFSDAGEKLGEFLSTAPSTTQSISFTVPASAVIAATRMRVRGVWQTAAGLDPCLVYNYGETEDYKIIIHSIATDVKEENGSVINIYPNPANEKVTIEISGMEEGSMLSIFNSLGQKMEEEKLDASATTVTKTVDVTKYAKGIYMICIESNGTKVFKKLVVN